VLLYVGLGLLGAGLGLLLTALAVNLVDKFEKRKR